MLKVDNKLFALSNKNYFDSEHKKTKIVVGNTFSNHMNHYIGWQKRLNGFSKKTSSFTIDIDGNIYQHYDPKFYSSFVGVEDLDKQIISILIENQGYLIKNIDKNNYIDYVGNIYNGEVIEKKWRNNEYWATYNDHQIKSLIDLTKMLCNTFNIPLQVIEHNIKIDNINDYNGVLYKSNFSKRYTDLSPAWDYIKFKNKIE